MICLDEEVGPKDRSERQTDFSGVCHKNKQRNKPKVQLTVDNGNDKSHSEEESEEKRRRNGGRLGRQIFQGKS